MGKNFSRFCFEIGNELVEVSQLEGFFNGIIAF